MQKKNKILLSKAVESLELMADEMEVYYHIPSGDFIWMADYGEFDEWNIAEGLKKSPDDYLYFIEGTQIDDYSIILSFIYSLDDEEKAERLRGVISGRGAFSRFKALAFELGIVDDWYHYRDEEYKKYAIEWCEENDFEYIDDTKQTSAA